MAKGRPRSRKRRFHKLFQPHGRRHHCLRQLPTELCSPSRVPGQLVRSRLASLVGISLKPIESPETMSRDSCAPLESIVLTWRIRIGRGSARRSRPARRITPPELRLPSQDRQPSNQRDHRGGAGRHSGGTGPVVDARRHLAR